MSWPSPRELFALPLVRVACGLAAIGIVAGVVWHSGATEFFHALSGVLRHVPAVAALEAAMMVCSTFALRELYAAEKPRVTPRAWMRAMFIGYAIGIIAPLGRAAAEASRAVALRRAVGGPRAAVAAVQMQGVALIANAIVSGLACVAAIALFGAGKASLFIGLNGVLAAVLGASILVARFAKPGRLLSGRAQSFGAAFDAAQGAGPGAVSRSLAWESGARALQLVQCSVVLGALGQANGALTTLATQGIQLVGGTVGDALPAQLGATELVMSMSASTLNVLVPIAEVFAFLIHCGQATLAALCGLGALGMPAEPALAAEPAEVRP